MEDHDIIFKVFLSICVIGVIVGLLVTIAEIALKGWLAVEGVKAVESAGGLAGIFEKILQLFQ